MNQIAHKFMAELKVYKDMANEVDYNERGIKTRSIANNGNGHDNSDSNDSDIRMMNVFLLAAFGWTPDLLKYMRGTSRSTFGFFLFFILFFVDLADAVFFDSIRTDNNARIRRRRHPIGSLAINHNRIGPYRLWPLWTEGREVSSPRR